MKMHAINEEVSKLSFKDNDKQVILKLIDTKIESDMERVLSEIKIPNAKFGSQIGMIKWMVSGICFVRYLQRLLNTSFSFRFSIYLF